MKKAGCLFIFISMLFIGCSNNINIKIEEDEVLAYEDIFDKIIRFHVIANSDSKEDQELKLKVRDEVIDFMVPKLQDAKTLDEAREILKENIETVNELAEEVIRDNSYGYSVQTMISHENFPDKLYGDVVFPAGEYEAFRIIIGEGQGKNWWCVMFPSLCFVDETKENVDSTTIVSEINNENNEQKVVFKIKLWDKLKELFS